MFSLTTVNISPAHCHIISLWDFFWSFSSSPAVLGAPSAFCVYFHLCVSASLRQPPASVFCVPTITLRAFPIQAQVPSHCVSCLLAFSSVPSYFYPPDMPSSTKKRTVAKKQPQQQQLSALLPPASAPITNTPSQNTASTLVQPINSNTPVATFDFSFFIKNANGTNVLRFLDAVSQTKEAQNLKLLFMRAVSEGKKLGYHEGEGVGYEQGYKKGKDCLHDLDVDTTYTAAFEEGRRKGEENEKWLWETLGHTYDQRCMSQQPTPETTSIGVQSELPYVPPMVSFSTQTSPPSLVNIDTLTSVATDSLPPVLPVSRLDWAEDATSLPILPLLPTPSAPRRHPPCDLSGLCSSGLNPFGSLQRRSKQSHAQIASRFCQTIPFTQSSHSHYRPPPLCPLASSPKPRIHSQASKKMPSISSCISMLDWDQDPRLSDLSQALKALGWIRP